MQISNLTYSKIIYVRPQLISDSRDCCSKFVVERSNMHKPL